MLAESFLRSFAKLTRESRIVKDPLTQMRTAKELIEELEREWEGAWRAALIVELEEEIKLVFADEKDRHSKLASLMLRGGEPGALFRATKEGKALKVETRFLPGYSAPEGVELGRLSTRIAQAIQGGMGFN